MDGDFRIEEWLVQPRMNRIRGPEGEAHLEPKVMDVLVYLARHSGEVLPKERIIEAVWPDTFVTDDVLIRAISELRKAFGHEGKDSNVIKTIPRRGYRLVLPVQQLEEREAEGQGPVVTSRAARIIASLIASVLLIAAIAWWLPFSTLYDSPLELTPLTALEGIENQPALSPDGKYLAFVADHADYRRVFVQLVGGEEPLQLTRVEANEGSPAWNSDGTLIAFLRETELEREVVAVSPLGGSERVLATTAASLDSGLDFSPDDAYLALVDRASETELGSFSVFLLSMRTGTKRPFTKPSIIEGKKTSDGRPAFSPDGTRIAFIRRLVGGGGGGLVCMQSLLEEKVSVLVPRAAVVWDIAWTDGGRSLIYSEGTTFGESSVNRVTIGRGDLVRLPFAEGARDLSVAANKFAFSRRMDNTNIWRIPGPRAEEGVISEKLIASTRDDYPGSYSPDGRKIAFISGRTGSWEVWVANSEGENPRRLTHLQHAIFPRWSPHGDRILFSSLNTSRERKEWRSDVYEVSVKGGIPQKLTGVGSPAHIPDWSPDGQFIFYQADEGGERQIWRQSLQSGQRTQLTSSTGLKLRPRAFGDRIFYWKEGKIWSGSVEGGEERLELDKKGAGLGFERWDIWKGNLVLLHETQKVGAVIECLDLQTQQVEWRASLGTDFKAGRGDLAVSPDGSWVLLGLVEHSGSDLMLVEKLEEAW